MGGKIIYGGAVNDVTVAYQRLQGALQAKQTREEEPVNILAGHILALIHGTSKAGKNMIGKNISLFALLLIRAASTA